MRKNVTIALLAVALLFCLEQVLADEYLNEPFNSLSAWTDETGWSFGLDIQSGAAHIYELDWDQGGGYQYGDHYISRVVSISGWSGTMYLELDWRAASNYAESSVTNAHVNLYDGSQSLGTVALVQGGTYDTGWQHKVQDVSSMLTGHSSVQVRLNVWDAWYTNWCQQAWFDNVKLYTPNNPPYTPSNPSPPSGATNQPVPNTPLSWNGGDPNGDSVTYHVYFGTSSPPPYSGDTSQTSANTIVDYGTTYYWKIVAEDQHGAQSSGPIWSFTTHPNSPPNAPSNPSPPNGAVDQPTSLTLSWTAGDPNGDTVTYKVYFGTTSPPPYDTTVGSTSIYKSGLGYGTTYYWKIVAQDEHGAQSSGAVWSFTTTVGQHTNNPPNTPSNPSPANGATQQPKSLSLSWTGGDPDYDTVTYKVYFGTTSPPPYDTTVGSTSIYKSGLGELTTYYWKIVAVDEHLSESAGPVWTFTTDPNGPPYTPSNPSPPNGATKQSTSLTLSWTGGDPEGDTVTYEFYFGTTSPPPYNTDVGQTSIPKSGLSRGTVYYWQIAAEDEHHERSVGDTWSFTTDPDYLYEPFDSVSAWTDCTYLKFDREKDVVYGAARIYEVAEGYENPQTLYDHYIERTVDISGWSGHMFLKLDWKAKSNWAGSSVTNAEIDLYDGSQCLRTITLVAGGTYETPWHYGETYDVTGTLTGHTSVRIRLRTYDWWYANWQQQAWFDNVNLYSVQNHPPNTPTNPEPTNGQTGLSTSITLKWDGGDIDPDDTVTYDVYVYRNWASPPPTPNFTATTNSKSLSGLGEGTRYYWKIVARDQHGTQRVGDVWEFRTEPGMYYGYYQVFDMGMSSHYGITPPNHIQNAASQSNVIVMSDRVYVTGSGFEDFDYDNKAVWNGFEIILYVHHTFRWYWFMGDNYAMPDPQKKDLAKFDCEGYRDNGLEENNIHVRAIYYFDEPVRGPNGSVMTAQNLADMEQVVNEVWPGRPTMLMFHRQGNEPALGEWAGGMSFDEVVETRDYVDYCDWVGVDPYPCPRYNAEPDLSLDIIESDMYWATSWQKPWVMAGQSWDPPDPPGLPGFAPFFEELNHVQYSHIMPDNTTIQTYYDIANGYGAKALLWFWYPDSYASSFDEDPDVQPVNNVWAKEREIWLAADLAWK